MISLPRSLIKNNLILSLAGVENLIHEWALAVNRKHKNNEKNVERLTFEIIIIYALLMLEHCAAELW